MTAAATAIETAEAIRAGVLSPVAATTDALERVDAWQSVTNAFSQIWREEAMDAARAAEAARGPAGPLHGVPIAVKDLFDVAGHETTGCSAVYAGNRVDRDAPVIERLRAAGAIFVGKTNQHELAMGATNLISACGPTRNPHDPTRITGGSSGGSAAAVTCGAVPLALGTDTGGSIRIPASFCGCFGLKPTFGRIPLEGVMPLAPSIDCPGPMASTASDLELLWHVMSGAERVGVPEVPRRVGVLGGYFEQRVHPDVTGAVGATVQVFEALGAEVVMVDGDGVEDALDVWVDLVCGEMAAAHPRAVEHRELLHPRIAGFVARGNNLSDDQMDAAHRRASEIGAWFAERLRNVGVLLAPTTPYPAPRSDQSAVEVGGGGSVDVQMGGTSIFTRPVSLSGLPAITIPAGLTDEGLPLSVQLIANRDCETALIGAARALEAHGERFRAVVKRGLP